MSSCQVYLYSVMGGSDKKKGKDTAGSASKAGGKKAAPAKAEPKVDAGPNEKARSRKVRLEEK